MSVTEKLPQQPARMEIKGTDGLALRQLALDDAQRYFDLVDFNREHFSHDPSTTQKYKTVEDVLDSIENPDPNKRRFGIWDSDVMVGSINLTNKRPRVAEIGYWIGAEYAGRGFARRATELIIPYAFGSLEVDILQAWVNPKNVASRKTLERAGFTQTTNGHEILYELHK